MVVAKPEILTNWTSYMVASYLIKDYKLCVEIWESIDQILGTNPYEKLKKHEANELYLFMAKVYETMGEYKKGIKFVTKYTKFIVDDCRRNEQLVRMYMNNN